MASSAAAIPPVVFKKSRRVNPRWAAAFSTNSLVTLSTQACSTVWQIGRNSSLDTICVGTAVGNVAPFFTERPLKNSLGECPMTHLFIYIRPADCVKYSKRCQASDAGADREEWGKAYLDLVEAADGFAWAADVCMAGICTTTSDWESASWSFPSWPTL